MKKRRGVREEKQQLHTYILAPKLVAATLTGSKLADPVVFDLYRSSRSSDPHPVGPNRDSVSLKPFMEVENPFVEENGLPRGHCFHFYQLPSAMRSVSLEDEIS